MKSKRNHHPAGASGLAILFSICLAASPAFAADYFHLGGSDGSRIPNADQYSNTNGSTTVATVDPGGSDNLFFYNSTVGAGPFNQRLELGASNKIFNSLTFDSNAGTTQIDRGGSTSTSKNILGLNAGGITVDAGAGPVTFGRLPSSGNNQGVILGVYQDLTVTNNSSSDLTFAREFDGRGTAQRTVTVAGSGSGNTIFNEIRSYDANRDVAMTINTSGTGIVRFDVGVSNHDYRGATTVTAGTLLVDGNVTVSNFSVGANGVLGGTGTIGGTVDFASGAKLYFDPSSSLTINDDVTFGGFDIGDLVGLDSSVSLDTYNLIVGTGTIDFTNISDVGVGNAVGIGGGKSAYFQEGSLQLVVIPEPSTLILLGISLACLAVFRRRK
ncbi:MAG: PEP-CTERM sorting domain-containing protein [Kiritimatiellia bacterium]